MTNNPRIYLWIALLAMIYLNYDVWQRDYGARPDVVTNTTRPANGGPASTSASSDLANQIPQAPKEAAPANGSGAAPTAATPAAAAAVPGSTAPSTPETAAAPVIHVRTDVLDMDISTRGGTLQRADLLKYPQVKGEATPVRLENVDDPQTVYLLQSGLAGPQPTPTHVTPLTSERSEYQLGNANELRVPLTWTSDQGVKVTKTFVFRRGEYRADIDYDVENQSQSPWTAANYAQIFRNDPRTKRSMFNVETYAYHGPALYDGKKYRKLDTSDRDDSHLSIDVTNGWIAALQHHFVTAVVPPRDQPYHFTLNAAGDQYRLAAEQGRPQTVAPGGSAKFGTVIFVGPKLQRQLKATGPDLARVTDYGLLYVLAQPLFTVLDAVDSFFGNWGVAIILVTFLLKLAFYPLSEASGRSMAKMKQLQPRIKNLQETYKDDSEKRGRAMMELYQREKINPIAGCLPIIIQIPVFLAFYWVLLESVEMRQAPFAFWIHDLSSRDPLFVLPAIMAAAMFTQYKLNPAPPDPVQAKVFMFMPLVMSFMFAFFPAGLVLYWVTNTVLSIAQQWNINRRIAAADAKKKT
jgi:YidC/Oxa1 family membrane protein insertase